jgi:hypothetical protein
MSSLKAPRWRTDVAGYPFDSLTRPLVASLLRGASAALARLARRLVARTARRRSDPRLEFYAEAGAPEGALYLDGQLVGFVEGVRRL